MRYKIKHVNHDEGFDFDDRAEESVVVTKRHVSAFSGSDLEIILRVQNIQHLILAGIATSGVAFSTVRETVGKDHHLTVLLNLCADSDAEAHVLLVDSVSTHQAALLSSGEWIWNS